MEAGPLTSDFQTLRNGLQSRREREEKVRAKHTRVLVLLSLLECTYMSVYTGLYVCTCECICLSEHARNYVEIIAKHLSANIGLCACQHEVF